MKLPQLATNLFFYNVVENSSFLQCMFITVQCKLKDNNKLSSGFCLFFSSLTVYQCPKLFLFFFKWHWVCFSSLAYTSTDLLWLSGYTRNPSEYWARYWAKFVIVGLLGVICSRYSNTQALRQGMRADLHAVATRNRTRGGKKKKRRILSLHSWLPVWSHLKLWDLPCNAFLPVCVISEHCSFSQLSKWVCCMNWQGHLRKCSSVPRGGTHKVVEGLYPESLSISAVLNMFITGTTDSTIKKSRKSQWT